MKSAHAAVVSVFAAAVLSLGFWQTEKHTSAQPDAAPDSTATQDVTDSEPDIAKATIVGVSLIEDDPAELAEHVTIVRWVDGDTFHGTYTASASLSGNVIIPWQPQKPIFVTADWHAKFPVTVRCYGIDAPESRGDTKAAGIAALEYARKLAPEGSTVTAITGPRGEEKFGRWLCDLKLPDGRLFSEAMIKDGHAVEYFGGSR